MTRTTRRRIAAIAALTLSSAAACSGTSSSTDRAGALSAASGTGGIAILMYHDIVTPEYVSSVRGGKTYSSDVWLDDFRSQMDTLQAQGYTPIFASEAAAYVRGETVKGDGRTPSKPIVLTFDDSFDAQYQVWRDVLAPRGFKATYFVITNYCDGQVTASGRHMTRDELREMGDSDVVEIQSHTVNHPDLKVSTPEELTRELADSRAALAAYGATYLAYPFGSHSAATVQEAKRWYDGAFCVGSSNALYGDDPYCIPRLGVGIWTHGAPARFEALLR